MREHVDRVKGTVSGHTTNSVKSRGKRSLHSEKNDKIAKVKKIWVKSSFEI